jgi:hypothetical protein
VRASSRGDVEVFAEREQRHQHGDAEQVNRLQKPERRDDGNEQYCAAE